MPIKRRIPKSRHAALPVGALELLLNLPLPPEANPFLPHMPRSTWRHWWAEAGDEVLQLWTRRRPGTRPPMWWQHVAPEPRRVLANGTRRTESEAAYLTRLNLLLPAEERRLRAADFEPVERHECD